ncbi:hypothetical protein [Breznakiella homolactica]|uniref:Glycosyl transferase family 1 domain-containing protein n=1 Tax=Breznakiella homolactica TaxID=2798577 RepID=A0A7T7XP51_9SPIR|nr:hypothetical protein [Breznakiella homolactica]QQO09823.1 hypothetical protein JFL75_02625 [Breznakiella homolactica]
MFFEKSFHKNKNNGVYKKVLDQIDAFKNHEIDISVLNIADFLPQKKGFRKINLLLNKKEYTKNIPNSYYNCDFFYIRYWLLTFPFLNLLKKIAEKKILIILEIPTYPYDDEYRRTDLKSQIFLLIDKLIRKKIKRYVNAISTYSGDEQIFDISTIKISNGLNFSRIPMRINEIKNNEINLLIISQFSFWHGYDRILKGLEIYVRDIIINSKTIVKLHFVGDGKEYEIYKNICLESKLDQYCFFYGLKSGKDLDAIANHCDIGVCSLGAHRKKCYLSSELKSREYVAYGLPMISSVKIDFVDDKWPYLLRVPEDDSPIDIISVVNYFNKVYKNNNSEEISRIIRSYGFARCDINVAIRPVIDYLANSKN